MGSTDDLRRAKRKWRNHLKLWLVAVICALPIIGGACYLQNLAKDIDTLPLDVYSDLRWAPDGKGLVFLHRALRQVPPAETEIWRVNSSASAFRQVGNLPADTDWRLTKNHSADWFLLQSEDQQKEEKLALSDGDGRVVFLEMEESWTRIPSQGDGLFYQAVEEAIPFDQFVDVEKAPDLDSELESALDDGYEAPFDGEELDSDPEPQEFDEVSRFDEELEPEPEYDPYTGELIVPRETPTRSGLKIARYNEESEELDLMFSIPYVEESDRPVIQLARRSPDERFLALVVKFGETGRPGLWVFDKENERLLWTRVLVSRHAHGIDWSSDSVRVAVSDTDGVAILENALGVDSSRFEVSGYEKLRPMWGAGLKLYLLNEKSVYQLDTERKVARPLFEVSASGATELLLDPIGSRVAYSASPRGYLELFVRDLKSQNLARSAYPGSAKNKAKGDLAYQVGSAIRFAWLKWSGQAD